MGSIQDNNNNRETNTMHTLFIIAILVVLYEAINGGLH